MVLLGFDSKTVQMSALCRSRREVSNVYLLAKFGFDTAENEPRKVCTLSVYRSPRFAFGCTAIGVESVPCRYCEFRGMLSNLRNARRTFITESCCKLRGEQLAKKRHPF